jgi:hypothetical protein
VNDQATLANPDIERAKQIAVAEINAERPWSGDLVDDASMAFLK